MKRSSHIHNATITNGLKDALLYNTARVNKDFVPEYKQAGSPSATVNGIPNLRLPEIRKKRRVKLITDVLVAEQLKKEKEII